MTEFYWITRILFFFKNHWTVTILDKNEENFFFFKFKISNSPSRLIEQKFLVIMLQEIPYSSVAVSEHKKQLDYFFPWNQKFHFFSMKTVCDSLLPLLELKISICPLQEISIFFSSIMLHSTNQQIILLPFKFKAFYRSQRQKFHAISQEEIFLFICVIPTTGTQHK